MECPNCHQHVIDTAERCGYCGWQLKSGKPSGVPYQQTVPPQASGQPMMPINPGMYPPQPADPKKKRRKAGWIWFLAIAALLVVIILVIVFTIQSRPPSYAYSPSYPQSDISNDVPPAGEPAPPEVPQESNPVIAVTEAPVQTQENPVSAGGEIASVQVPDPLNELLNGWYIETSYMFDTLASEAWNYTEGKVYSSGDPSNPNLVMDAQDGSMATLSSTFELYPGSAFLMQFSPSGFTDFEAFLSYGDVTNSDYRRFGIGFTDYSVVMNNWRGTNTLDSGTNITGEFSSGSYGYYMLLIAIDQDGTAKAQIWDVYDPANKTNITSFNGGITDLTWTFTVNVGQGALVIPYIYVLYFDSYN